MGVADNAGIPYVFSRIYNPPQVALSVNMDTANAVLLATLTAAVETITILISDGAASIDLGGTGGIVEYGVTAATEEITSMDITVQYSGSVTFA